VDRQPRPEALSLPLVHEDPARKRVRHDRRRAEAIGREHRSGARLVVVLQEADEMRLPGGIREQVRPYAACVADGEAVVQALVVAEVDALIDEVGFAIPVRLCEEEELGMEAPQRTCHLAPVRLGSNGLQPIAPRRRSDVVEEEHRHVAADAVALLRDVV
jgi:hypothetical protein